MINNNRIIIDEITTSNQAKLETQCLKAEPYTDNKHQRRMKGSFKKLQKSKKSNRKDQQNKTCWMQMKIREDLDAAVCLLSNSH